jgi:hypothetical protein
MSPLIYMAGRNTKLQGLAAAILKLWEKSLIAKIAVKVGIQNTNNEQMAWNLKASTIPPNPVVPLVVNVTIKHTISLN